MVDILQSRDAVERAARWDRAGIVVSTACAVHCTVLPFVAGLVPILGLQHFANERVEWLSIALTALVGIVGHLRAYRRHHRHLGPGLMFVAGVGVIIVTRAIGGDSVLEPVALALGGLFAASAHWINLRLCRCCEACDSAGGEKEMWVVMIS